MDEVKVLVIAICTSIHCSWVGSEIFHVKFASLSMLIYICMYFQKHLKFRECTELHGLPTDAVFPQLQLSRLRGRIREQEKKKKETMIICNSLPEDMKAQGRKKLGLHCVVYIPFKFHSGEKKKKH